MSGQSSAVADYGSRRERVTWRLDPSNYDFVNHLRDCLKYIVSALVEPEKPTPEQRAWTKVQGLNLPKEDVTSQMFWYQDALFRERAQDSAPRIPMGRRGAMKLAMIEAWKRSKGKNGIWN